MRTTEQRKKRSNGTTEITEKREKRLTETVNSVNLPFASTTTYIGGIILHKTTFNSLIKLMHLIDGDLVHQEDLHCAQDLLLRVLRNGIGLIDARERSERLCLEFPHWFAEDK